MEFKISNEWIAKMTDTPWHTEKEHYQPVFTFSVDRGQANQYVQWSEDHNKTCKFAGVDEHGFSNTGAIGGLRTFTFTDTSLGQVCKVQCGCGAEVDLTEYGEW